MNFKNLANHICIFLGFDHLWSQRSIGLQCSERLTIQLSHTQDF
jgi:hypothetical protein